MTGKLVLKKHPRLYWGEAEMKRVRRTPTNPVLASAAEIVARDATRFSRMPPLTYPRDVHNEHLHRAREVQNRVMTLLVRFAQTGDERCRRAVLDYIAIMDSWECWSWITWRQGNFEPNAIFDLSYGENSVTLALAYDQLYDTLSPDERSHILGVAKRRALGPYCYHVKNKQWPDWYNFTNNWNAVCSGGGGVLALAMHDDLPEARRAVTIAERTLPRFLGTVRKGGGGWVEGTGYWNYGMCYAFRYMMSYESASGRKHPLMRDAILRKTMSFPFDFTPNGVPCSFGDNNRWAPLPFHYAAAERFGLGDVRAELDSHLGRQNASGDPGLERNAAEWLVLHPGRKPARRRAAGARTVRLYKGLDWGVLADRKAAPEIHLAFRGGTTQVPHSNRDLLSFHCVVGSEPMITSLSPAEYLDTTGSDRRQEIFENSPFSKNTILLNGVGITHPSTLERTQLIKLPGAEGVRMEATSAFGEMRDGPAAKFCARLILMLKERAYLVIDRAELNAVGRMESRMHSPADVKAARAHAVLRNGRERLRVAYACTVPSIFQTAVDAPTRPTSPHTALLRWCPVDQHKDITMAALLSPGAGRTSVEIANAGRQIHITATGKDWKRVVKLTRSLRPAKAAGTQP